MSKRSDAEAPPGLDSRATQGPSLAPESHSWKTGPTVTMAVCARLPFRTVFVGPAGSQRDGGVLRWVRAELARAQWVTQPCSPQRPDPPALALQGSLSSGARGKLEAEATH